MALQFVSLATTDTTLAKIRQEIGNQQTKFWRTVINANGAQLVNTVFPRQEDALNYVQSQSAALGKPIATKYLDTDGVTVCAVIGAWLVV